MMDKKAKSILFKTYWTSTGWNNQRYTSPEDFAYAKAKGVMFDPVSLTHESCLADILALCERIPPAKAARAFLSSLSTRRLDWRSAIASAVMAQHLAPHPYTPVVNGHGYGPGGVVTSTQYTCGPCRDAKGGSVGHAAYRNIDLNVLNFERLKWGGVRHGELDYTWFDLQQLALAEIPDPTSEDLGIFHAILMTIAASLPGDTPGKLEKALAPVLPSSQNERRTLIEILACLDILRPLSPDRRGGGDWKFAACWRGEDRYDALAVHAHFGSLIVLPCNAANAVRL